VTTKYRTIVADPPWSYAVKTIPPTKRSPDYTRGAADHYSTMTMQDIADLPISELTEVDAHLYLWVTNPILTEQRLHGGPNVFAIVRSWGFEPKTLLTGVKSESGAGLGFYFRGDTEHVVFAVRGNLPISPEIRRSNVFRFRRGHHSAKPESFLDLVESVSPGPYLELFARRNRLGWDTWGDECLDHGVAL
jgi:N6-adenosine-specific RNA methylase IME4